MEMKGSEKNADEEKSTKENAPALGEGIVVEVRGVEPRSEEKTLKTPTYIARLLRFAPGNSGPVLPGSRKAGQAGLAECYPKRTPLLTGFRPIPFETRSDYPVLFDVRIDPNRRESKERVA